MRRLVPTLSCKETFEPEPGPGPAPGKLISSRWGTRAGLLHSLRERAGAARARAPGAGTDQPALQRGTISFVRFLEISSSENKLDKLLGSFNDFPKWLELWCPVSLTAFLPPPNNKSIWEKYCWKWEIRADRPPAASGTAWQILSAEAHHSVEGCSSSAELSACREKSWEGAKPICKTRPLEKQPRSG